MSSHGYILIRVFGDDVYEHRLVMEKHLGQPLKIGEVVHHIDGDITNNHIDNLILFPNVAAHLAYHKERNLK